ncbi:tetratricopeptide repeat protein [Alteromonas sp. a30]|uniref:tetratricopeptide repeat protein n=1 Tax=Alteromonas sp. a30 TaxID=2730917 RepID=UPI00227F5872|nr:hypothetical protein [Alteromonas sp. a30]MCY7294136.1 sel1 repeat family protein [Alteromonas sp. a30]
MSQDSIINATPNEHEDDLSLEGEPELEFEDEEFHEQESASILQVDSVIDSNGHMDMAHHSGHSPVETANQQFATGVHQIKAMGNHYLGAKWFRKAGMQGHAKAQFYLGLMFIKGEGVPKSLFHAYCWLSLACCQNFEEAKTARKNLEPYLTAKEMNSALRLAADRIEQIFEH